MTTNISNKDRHDMNQMMASGWRKHCSKSGGLIVNTQKKSGKEIDSDLQLRSNAEDKVIAARAALHGAILERERIEEETADVFNAVRQTILIQYGTVPEVLADFGLAPKKQRRSRTLAEKVDAATRAQQTKEARHVMGKRQRLAIRAEVSPPHGSATTAPAPTPVAVTTPAPVAVVAAPPVVTTAPVPAVIPPTPITPPAAIPGNPITPNAASTPVAPTNGAPAVNGAAAGGGGQ